MRKIITFYSYKGGVGRSMCLANVAVLLNSWGLKVLIIDWDLEAPGLEHYFSEYISLPKATMEYGIIDILDSSKELNWTDHLIQINIEDREPIDLLTSGKKIKSYHQKVRDFDIERFYKSNGWNKIETLRKEWEQNYDFVLIDSRTGITDFGGICTIHLPDIVMLLFTPNNQGFQGTLDIVSRAKEAQQNLPFEREKLIFLPVITKVDSNSEFRLTQEWLQKFSKQLNVVYDDWLPVSLNEKEFLELTKVPYSSYFSFGETLPVIEEGTNNPSGLGYAYESISSLIANKLNDVEEFYFDRSNFINSITKNNEDEQIERDKNVNIFISYAFPDSKFRISLRNNLHKITKSYNLKIWDDQDFTPGILWSKEIKSFIKKSDIILILYSEKYKELSSTPNNDLSLEYNLIQKESNKFIIPIVTDTVKEFDSFVSSLVRLPKNGMSLNSNNLNSTSLFNSIINELIKTIKTVIENKK